MIKFHTLERRSPFPFAPDALPVDAPLSVMASVITQLLIHHIKKWSPRPLCNAPLISHGESAVVFKFNRKAERGGMESTEL